MAIAQAIGHPAVDPVERRAALAWLVRQRAVDALADLAGRADLDDDLRSTAITALPADPRFVPVLQQAADTGPADTARAARARLGLVPVPALVLALTAQPSPALLHALGQAAAARPRAHPERATAQAALLGQLGRLDYVGMYRVAFALARIGDASARAALARAATAWPRDAAGLGWRRAVARGLAAAAADAATGDGGGPDDAEATALADALVTQLLADANPGVRLDALTTVTATADGTPPRPPPIAAPRPARQRELTSLVANDPWPEVRAAAAHAQAALCATVPDADVSRAARDRLAGRDRHPPETDDATQVAIAGAAITCAGPTAGDVLTSLVSDDALPLAARRALIRQAAQVPTAAAALLPLFTRWRAGAYEHADDAALAIQAAMTLGIARPPGAADALIGALSDGALPDLVIAAADGLARMGTACPRTAVGPLRQLLRHDRREVVSAARLALARCPTR